MNADPLPSLELAQGRPVVSSLRIAESFGKEHKHVIEAIRKLSADLPQDFTGSNFWPSEYSDSTGRKLPAFNLTRDGFTLLAMGFTGKKALAWKLRYIEAFNAMEAELAALVEEGRVCCPLPEPDGLDEPPVLPSRYRRLRPHVRTAVLNAAVQVAKLENSGMSAVKSYFLEFCELMAPPETLSPLIGGDDSGLLLEEWAALHLEKHVGGRVQSKVLYAHFRRWCRQAKKAAPPSWRWFGEWMSDHYRKHHSNRVWYCGIRLLPANENGGKGGQDDDELMPVNEAARELGISASSVYRMIEEGLLKSTIAARQRQTRVFRSSIREHLRLNANVQ